VSYSYVYFIVLCFFSFYFILCSLVPNFQGQRSSVLSLGVFSVFLFLVLSSFRLTGIDYVSYETQFKLGLDGSITELGFRLLSELIPLPFRELFIFYLFSVLCFYILFWNVRKTFGWWLAFAFLLIYLSHSYIVRDLSQTRVGIAISFVTSGFLISKRSEIRASLFYFLGAMFHISIIPLLGLIIIYKSKLSTKFKYLVMLVGIFISSRFAYFISSQFPKAQGYMDDPNRATEVSSVSFVLFHGALTLISICSLKSRVLSDKFSYWLRAGIFFQVSACTWFVFFSDFSIFASRIGNILSFLYPLLFLIGLRVYSLKFSDYNNIIFGLFVVFFSFFLSFSRSSSLEVIKDISF